MNAFHSDFRFWPYEPAHEPPPGRIAGPAHYIGTLTVCAYLVETAEGPVLIDSGFEADFDVIRGNIRKLGFDPSRIRAILNTHWHEDHTGGNAAFARISGCRVMIHEADAGIVESGLFKGRRALAPSRVDQRLTDNEIVRFGGVAFRAVHCPGQSPGSAVFLADLPVPDGTCRALFCGDATGFKCSPELYDRYGYPGCAIDYRRSVEKLKSLEFDLYLGGHPHQVVREIRPDGNPFISRDEWIRMVEARHAKMEAFAKVSGQLLSF